MEELSESHNEIDQNLKLIQLKAKDKRFKAKVVKLSLTEKINTANQIILPSKLKIINPEQVICTKKSFAFKGKLLIKIELRIKK